MSSTPSKSRNLADIYNEQSQLIFHISNDPSTWKRFALKFQETYEYLLVSEIVFRFLMITP